MKHIYQPTGNTCGPTCLKMVHDFLLTKGYSNNNTYSPKDFYSVDEISMICGTDWIVGTPPDRLIKGLKELKIKHVEFMSMPRPYEFLRNLLNTGNLAILRTITEGVPHWIIASGCNDDSFTIKDPWKGEITYTDAELEKIWKQRNYQFFEIILPEDFYSHVEGQVINSTRWR